MVTGFFKAQLGNYLLSSPLIKEESLFVQEQSRIPYTGMKQQLYTDLTMLVSLGHAQEGENIRSIEYFERFKMAQQNTTIYHKTLLI